MYYLNPPKIMESQLTVRFVDCDPLGHLSNSRYLDYLFEAREEQVLDNYGFDFFAMAKDTGCTWVSTENRIVYLRETRAKEKVIVSSKTIKISERGCVVELIMYNQDKTHIKVVLWATVVYFNLRTRKSEVIPAELSDYFQEVLVEIPEKSFEDRMRYIKTNNTIY